MVAMIEYPSTAKSDNSNSCSLFPPLPDTQFEIVYADPPWSYGSLKQHRGAGKGTVVSAVDHYNTVTTEHLRQLDIPKITADDCLLFMWAVSPKLDDAIELGEAWGFKYTTVAFVWYKQAPNPGNYTISECELCLVFKHGRIPKPRGARNMYQFVSEKRRAHSQKPDEVRKRIERMFPSQSKIELFARQTREGWTVWGDQPTKFKDYDYVEQPPIFELS